MMGLSLTKILFTILVVVVVWWMFKTIQRRHQQMTGTPRESVSERAARSAREAVRATMEKRGNGPVVEDLEQCPKCGAYVPKGTECGCGKG